MNLSKIHHIAIIVSNYEAAKNFYVNILGFSVIRENYRPERKDWKLDLRVNEYTELEIFAEENPPKRVNRPEACGLRHLAFCVDSVEQTVKELAEVGIECEPIRVDDYTGNPAKYQMVKEQIVIIFNENKKRYGYRRITKELHNNDICVNHKTVRKLMKQLGLVCQVRAKRKYSSYKGEVGEVAPNLLERHFKTNQPNRKWVTDVTEFKVNDQKLYLSPILDLFNGEVVSYNLSRHLNFKQITDMLEGAFQKLPDKVDNLILHSDQGWQYQMKSYQNLLKAKGITQSMSRKATCLDNAVAENFFGLLKTELFYLEKFDSIDQLEKAIVDYIDYYNNRRIKLKLNGLSPVQYRIQTVGAA